MFRSKHSGWTWELKRTPFGVGGGVISDIGNAVSNAVSDVGNIVQNDVITPISNAGVSIDQTVNNAIPGGWATVGGAALLAAGIADPTLLGLADSGALTPDALANAGVSQDTIDALGSGSITAPSSYVSPSQALTTDISGSTGGTSIGATTGGSTSGIAIPSSSAITVDPSIAAGSGANLAAAGTTATGAATGAGLSGTSGLNAALPAAGANAGAGTGLSAALAPNTVLGTGLAGGGDIGVAYQLGANGLPATDWLGNPIEASSVGLNGSTATSSILPNPTQLATALKNLGAATQKNATQTLPTVHYQSAFLPSAQTVPVEGSRLTTTPTALKLASLLQ